jgi:hypothetical protein
MDELPTPVLENGKDEKDEDEKASDFPKEQTNNIEPIPVESNLHEENTIKRSESPKEQTNTEPKPLDLNLEPSNAQDEGGEKLRKSAPSPTSNCILFYGVTYLGCSSVNAPKSEAEINRVMSTLNEQGQLCVEVTMSVPQSIEEKIVLYDSANMESKIAEYKMAHVLFVVRGSKSSPEHSCFAFTTCHGDVSSENFFFSCHVFRCNIAEAVSKILYSFWTVFNRQSIQNQQNQQSSGQQQAKALASKTTDSVASSISLVTSTTGQLSSVASSLLGSFDFNNFFI